MKPTVTCEELESLYASFLENRATREEMQLIHNHLRFCLRCRSSLAWTMQAMSGACNAAPPAGFLQRLMTRLRKAARPTNPA